MAPKRKRSTETGPVDEEKDGPSTCTICMDEISARGKLSVCSHWFCFTCIHEWSKNTNTCPLCKRRFRCITKVHVDGKGSPPRKIRISDKDQSMHEDEEENQRVAEEIDAQSSEDSDLYDDDYEPAIYNWTNNRGRQNYYDLSDSFIDDSEDDIAVQLQMFSDLCDNRTEFINDNSSDDSESDVSESSATSEDEEVVIDLDVSVQQGSSISRRTRSRRRGQMSIGAYMRPSQNSSPRSRTSGRPPRSTRSSNTETNSNNRGSRSRYCRPRSRNRGNSSGINRNATSRNTTRRSENRHTRSERLSEPQERAGLASSRASSSGINRNTTSRNTTSRSENQQTRSERNEPQVIAPVSATSSSSAQSGIHSARVQAEARIREYVTEESSLSTGWRRKVTTREGGRVRKYFTRESTRNSQRNYHYSSDESDDDSKYFTQNTSTPNHRRQRVPASRQDIVPPTPPSRHSSTRSNTYTDMSPSATSRTVSIDTTAHNAKHHSQGPSTSSSHSTRSSDNGFLRKPLSNVNVNTYHVNRSNRSHAQKREKRKRVYMMDSDSD